MKIIIILLSILVFSCSENTKPKEVLEEDIRYYGADFNADGLKPNPTSERSIQEFPITKGYLTYKIYVPPFFDSTSTTHEVHEAFLVWEKALGGKVKFYPVYDVIADIEISFRDANHYSDSCEYDKGFSDKQGTLAHAMPYNSHCLAGEIHFNSDLLWTLSTNHDHTYDRIFNFRTSLIHEIGHILGLEHSDVKESVMYYEYPADSKGRKFSRHTLDTTDIININNIYK